MLMMKNWLFLSLVMVVQHLLLLKDVTELKIFLLVNYPDIIGLNLLVE